MDQTIQERIIARWEAHRARLQEYVDTKTCDYCQEPLTKYRDDYTSTNLPLGLYQCASGHHWNLFKITGQFYDPTLPHDMSHIWSDPLHG